MGLSRKQVFALFFVLGIIAGPAAQALAGYLSNHAETTDVPLSASNGPTVTVTGTTQTDLTNPFPSNDTVHWITQDGNLTVTGTSGTNISVGASDLDATTVNYTALNVSAGPVTIDHEQHSNLTIEGGTDWFELHSLGIDDSNTDIRYAGGSGSTTVTLRGLPANRQIAFVDVNQQVALANGKVSNSGTITATLPNSQHTIELRTGRPPVLSNPSPTGDLQFPPDSLSIQLNDSDYPDENHTVDFYLDGNLVETKQANQNKTVSTSINAASLTAGEHTWRVRAEDGYGYVAEKGYTFRVPDELVVRNESTPDQLVNNTTVKVDFFASDQVIRRQTTNGTISLKGLPVGQQFIVTATADNYTSRTTVLDSLYQQQSVYLLPNGTETVDVRFLLEDTTGSYPQDSTLYIERVLTQNNSTSYKTIISDEFGVQGVTTTLKQGDRYQIRIKSPDGDTAVLGAYTADVSETVTLRPDTASVELTGEDETIGYDAYKENDAIKVEFSDPTNSTDYLSVTIYERYNEDNVLRPSQTYYDLGNVSLSEPLSNATRNKTWVVELSGKRNGKTVNAKIVVGNGPRDLIPSDLDGVWRATIGVFVLLVSALIFSQLNVAVGAVTTAITGSVLWWIGLLNGVATGASIVLSIGVAVVYNAIIQR